MNGGSFRGGWIDEGVVAVSPAKPWRVLIVELALPATGTSLLGMVSDPLPVNGEVVVARATAYPDNTLLEQRSYMLPGSEADMMFRLWFGGDRTMLRSGVRVVTLLPKVGGNLSLFAAHHFHQFLKGNTYGPDTSW